KNLILAAAACAIAAGNAAAQTYKADIPFTFRAGKTTLAAGSYQIHVGGNTSAKFLTVRNMETREAIMLQTASLTGEQTAGSAPKRRCGCGRTCALSALWVGGWEGAYKLHMPRLEPNETAGVKTIELTLVKAD